MGSVIYFKLVAQVSKQWQSSVSMRLVEMRMVSGSNPAGISEKKTCFLDCCNGEALRLIIYFGFELVYANFLRNPRPYGQKKL
jgi:hypothetical protein